MKKMLITLVSGILSGFLVGIGGSVYLSCVATGDTMVKIVGSFLFAVALITICVFSLYLFTGKIGYLATERTFSYLLNLVIGLLGNVIGAAGCALLISFSRPSLCNTALTVCEGKLQLSLSVVFVLASFCGVLMYIAVEIYKSKGSSLGMIYCIPVFILIGFEHSVADVYYFTLSGISPVKFIVFILVAVVGNAVGSILTRTAHVFANKNA